MKNENQLIFLMAHPNETQSLLKEIPVIFTGIGKVNAAMTCTETILKTQCRHIVNLGTAGSLKHPTGTLMQVKQVFQRDMDLTSMGLELGLTPLEKNSAYIDCEMIPIDLPVGICATADKISLIEPESHKSNSNSNNHIWNQDQIIRQFDLLDMEAFALAKVCKKMNVAFSSFKFVTDQSDGNISHDWKKNLLAAAESFQKLIPQLISKARIDQTKL